MWPFGCCVAQWTVACDSRECVTGIRCVFTVRAERLKVPASTVIDEFLTYARTARNRIDAELEKWLPGAPRVPARLAEAMRYAVLPGGKRLRPVLVLLACEATGGELEEALPSACAIEFVHCYSLVHDDLPAMDDSDLRRGRPTVHRAFDEATAILAGDALLTLAFEVLARGIADPAVLAASVAELATAAGAAGMVGGQMEDLIGMGDGQPLERLHRIHELKTGALLRCAVRLGAIAARATEDQRAILDRYADAVGLAFQIVDDLLDVVGDAEALGKPVHQDENKLTFPAVLGVDGARAEAARLVEEACAHAELLGNAGRLFVGLARYVLERNR